MQSATDSAALALASAPAPAADPTAVALSYISANFTGFSASAPTVAAAQNADGSYTVTGAVNVPMTIAAIVIPSRTVRRSSTAAAGASPALASFAIGSGLASLNGGVLNAVLGGMLGTNLSLSIMDYNALASANIDLFQFSQALATRVQLNAVTYDQLVAGSYSVGNIVGAAKALPSLSSAAQTALTQIANAVQGSSTKASLATLVNFGPYGSLTVGAQPTTVSISALDLINAVAQIANGAHQVQANVDAGIPGLANVTLALTIGERPVSSSMVTVGATGASVHTAQTRALLTSTIVVPGVGNVVLPVYLELAAATATLNSVSCPSGPASAQATLGVTPSLANGWIGTVSASQMTNFTTRATASPANLINVKLALADVTVTALANANIGNLSATPVVFSAADIQAALRKTTSTQDYAASLLSSLVGNLQLSGTAAGVTVALPNTLTSAIGTSLAAAVTPLDQLISSVLNALGASVGNAYTWVSAAQCGGRRQVRLTR